MEHQQHIAPIVSDYVVTMTGLSAVKTGCYLLKIARCIMYGYEDSKGIEKNPKVLPEIARCIWVLSYEDCNRIEKRRFSLLIEFPHSAIVSL